MFFKYRLLRYLYKESEKEFDWILVNCDLYDIIEYKKYIVRFYILNGFVIKIVENKLSEEICKK